MPSSNQIEKKMDHLFFSLFELDPENEEDSIFIGDWNEGKSNHGMDIIALLAHEEIRSTGLRFTIRLAVEVNSL